MLLGRSVSLSLLWGMKKRKEISDEITKQTWRDFTFLLILIWWNFILKTVSVEKSKMFFHSTIFHFIRFFNSFMTTLFILSHQHQPFHQLRFILWFVCFDRNGCGFNNFKNNSWFWVWVKIFKFSSLAFISHSMATFHPDLSLIDFVSSGELLNQYLQRNQQKRRKKINKKKF